MLTKASTFLDLKRKKTPLWEALYVGMTFTERDSQLDSYKNFHQVNITQ